MEGVSKDWPGKLTPLPRVLLTRNFSAPDGHGQSKDRRVEQRSGGDIMGFKLLRTKSYGSAFNALSGAVKGAGKGFEGEQDGKSRSHRRKTSFPSALYRWKPTDSATKHSTRPSVVSVSGRSHRHRPQRQVSQGTQRKFHGRSEARSLSREPSLQPLARPRLSYLRRRESDAAIVSSPTPQKLNAILKDMKQEESVYPSSMIHPALVQQAIDEEKRNKILTRDGSRKRISITITPRDSMASSLESKGSYRGSTRGSTRGSLSPGSRRKVVRSSLSPRSPNIRISRLGSKGEGSKVGITSMRGRRKITVNQPGIQQLSKRGLKKITNIFGESPMTLKQKRHKTDRISPCKLATHNFGKVQEYRDILKALNELDGTTRVASAELRFYLKQGGIYEYQDSPVDLLQDKKCVQVLLLRESHSKKKGRPKWKPLVFMLAPGDRLGIQSVHRNCTEGSTVMYSVEFKRNKEGYPINFAKNVLRINNWSSNTIVNRLKKAAINAAIKRIIRARTDVQAAVLNGEVVLIPQSHEDDIKIHTMFSEIFGTKGYTF
ncbi:hypothetical protein AAMO2058_000516100 [Amorphochlora amoebiformis]